MPSVRPRDAAATKRRLLDAARAEFARVGIAGARVDRIAADADSNKAQIYHYFGSKDRLFDAVFEDLVAWVLSEVPIDAGDLPGYAARLHDGYTAHPEVARLAAWYQLERGGQGLLIQAIVDSNQAKVDAIRDAQAAGRISSAFPPEVLLGLVIQLAGLWVNQTPEYLVLTASLTAAERRAHVVAAVKSLVATAG